MGKLHRRWSEIVQHDFHAGVFSPPRNGIDKGGRRGILSRREFHISRLDRTERGWKNLPCRHFAGGIACHCSFEISDSTLVTFKTTNAFCDDQDICGVVLFREFCRVSCGEVSFEVSASFVDEILEFGSHVPFSSNRGGRTKPPNRSSISSAAWIGVRSSRYGPTIWIPMGNPAEVKVIGLAVAGRYAKLASAPLQIT